MPATDVLVTPLTEGEQHATDTSALSRHAERFVSLTLMAALRGPNDLHSVMREVMQLVHSYTNCEAIGIRLADDDDFPYFETRGFSDEFVEKERHLCARSASGKLLRDAMGKPILECMCGNVLCGRTDSTKPFFTPNGSFWSNNTTKLLASTTEADRQSHTRNRCNGAGYETVALFPLRVQGRTFGLLQVNDHRPDRLPPEDIQLLERLADVVALALSERFAEERLRRSLAEKEALLREVHHRVKNNLQTMVSLLNLQARRIEDPRARAHALDTQARIHAMAIVHEQLYAQTDVSRVDLNAFTRLLVDAAFVASGRRSVRLNLELTTVEVFVSAERAVAFGLIIHELITNSLRHAFPDDQDGTVAVAFAKLGPREVSLRISDDGKGLDDSVKFPGAESFGLSLVEMLSTQLKAKLSLSRGPGTTFEFAFGAGAAENES